MNPFWDDRKNSRKDPFDFFGFDDEFERMFRRMERMWESAFRDFNFDNLEPGKPFVHGFNIRINSDGKPNIEEFGHKPKKIDNGKTIISDEREPLTDIIEGDNDVAITIEIPGVNKEDINLNITKSYLDINVDSPNRKYQKSIDLPCIVKPNTSKATYKNGILDIVIKKKEKRKNKEGHHININ
jgi:HSP20 family protein